MIKDKGGRVHWCEHVRVSVCLFRGCMWHGCEMKWRSIEVDPSGAGEAELPEVGSSRCRRLIMSLVFAYVWGRVCEAKSISVRQWKLY